MEEHLGLRDLRSIAAYFRSATTPTMVPRPSSPGHGSRMRAPSGSPPGKSRRARLSLISTDAGRFDLLEPSAADQRHAEHRPEIRRDRADRRRRRASRFSCGIGSPSLSTSIIESRPRGQRRGLAHAGQRLRLRQQRRRVFVTRTLLAILRSAEIHAHRQDLIRREAGRIASSSARRS